MGLARTNQDGSYTYTYDNTGQLTNLDASGGTCGATGCDESFSYDVSGNRTMTGYTTGTGNRLTSDGTHNYTYDDNGNTLTKTRISDGQKYEFSWDYRNRLMQVLLKNSAGTILQQSDFTYDAFDRRIIKTHDPDGPGSQQATTTKTIYDGANFAANPYADFDGNNALTMRYLYGPAIDMILARRDASGNVTWYLTDHLGTVRDLVNTSGTVIDHITYSAYGKVTTESQPSNGDRFKFTGREYESATAQYYYRARYYDPSAARYLSNDSLSFAAGDANLYRYLNNSPLLRTDPSGQIQWQKPWDPQNPKGVGPSKPFYTPPPPPPPWTRDEAKVLGMCKGDPNCEKEVKRLFEVMNDCEKAPYHPNEGACGTFANEMARRLANQKFHHLKYEQKYMKYYKKQEYFGFSVSRSSPVYPFYFQVNGFAEGHTWYEFTVCPSAGVCQTFYVDAGWTYGGQLQGNYGGPDHIFFQPPIAPQPPPREVRMDSGGP